MGNSISFHCCFPRHKSAPVPTLAPLPVLVPTLPLPVPTSTPVLVPTLAPVSVNTKTKTPSLESKLKKIERKHLCDFTFKTDHPIPAKIVDVYDGDTCRIAFGYPTSAPAHTQTIVMKSCRLSGIDTPEIRTKNLKEKERGLLARDCLKSIVLNSSSSDQLVYVRFEKDDKYGRPLVTIYLNKPATEYMNFEQSVNYQLVSLGFARLYDGHTKQPWNL